MHQQRFAEFNLVGYQCPIGSLVLERKKPHILMKENAHFAVSKEPPQLQPLVFHNHQWHQGDQTTSKGYHVLGHIPLHYLPEPCLQLNSGGAS